MRCSDKPSYEHIPWRDTHIKIVGPVIDSFVNIYKGSSGDPVGKF